MLNTTLNNTLISNPFLTKSSLKLNQIEGYVPVESFIDDSNTKWVLVKSCFDSTRDIPDPKTIQVIDQWNHVFPGLKSEIYVYVVEGIRSPRVETEQPTRVLYQWFSPVMVKNFSAQMITENEWLKANVYAAPIIDVRTSKLNAICRITNTEPEVKEDNTQLLKVEELNGITQGITK